MRHKVTHIKVNVTSESDMYIYIYECQVCEYMRCEVYIYMISCVKCVSESVCDIKCATESECIQMSESVATCVKVNVSYGELCIKCVNKVCVVKCVSLNVTSESDNVYIYI